MHPSIADRSDRPHRPAASAAPRRWTALALPVAASWSLGYLGLGVAWLTGAGGNPADPAVDGGVAPPLLGLWGAHPGAWLITGLAALGVGLALAMAVPRRPRDLPTVPAALLGLTLAVVLPDYRLIAMMAYTVILPFLRLFGVGPQQVSLWPWPVVNQAVLTVAGLCWLVAAAVHHRAVVGARTVAAARAGVAAVGVGVAAAGCVDLDGGVPTGRRWTTPQAAARWGRWAVAVAVAIPTGYAVTRIAWALGIPLGVSDALLDELGPGRYAGAGLGILAVGGAVLTLGLVQGWGEVFPRWMPVVHGRPVPVGLAVVPGMTVSAVVTSAGLVFFRYVVDGQFARAMPGTGANVAAWLPELFWPLWGLALAAATQAYRLRRCGGPE